MPVRPSEVSREPSLLFDQDLDAGGFWFRVLLLVVFAVWGMAFLFSPMTGEAMSSFWHRVNLPFHEAGHIFFSMFGRLCQSAGGSIFQLTVPIVCLGVLLIKTRDAFGASICFWWFGQNFMDLAPYIDDARRGTLPLLGGNTGADAPYGFHDWEFILTELGLIRHDHLIASLSFYTGKLIILVSLIWGATILIRTYGRVQDQ